METSEEAGFGIRSDVIASNASPRGHGACWHLGLSCVLETAFALSQTHFHCTSGDVFLGAGGVGGGSQLPNRLFQQLPEQPRADLTGSPNQHSRGCFQTCLKGFLRRDPPVAAQCLTARLGVRPRPISPLHRCSLSPVKDTCEGF